MRLTRYEITAIKESVIQVYADNAEVWLFGSRVNDSLRGGDIDLLIRPLHSDSCNSYTNKLHLLKQLEIRLGERKIDIVIEQRDDHRAIVKVALENGIQL